MEDVSAPIKTGERKNFVVKKGKKWVKKVQQISQNAKPQEALWNSTMGEGGVLSNF